MTAASRSRPARHPVVVIGGGQAGLAMSYCLKQRGIEHVVFEKNGLAHAWKTQRWDSFSLVTPNWQCRLPGFDYPGNDPHGFMKRDEIVTYIEAYAASFRPPLQLGVAVSSVRCADQGGFELQTSIGPRIADQLVVAVGGYHTPILPRFAERLPTDLVQLHASEYRNPESLPPGAVLVVGSGQSGCQIAEDLHLARRRVHLCVGGAPRSPRSYRGSDVVDWLHAMGYYDMPIQEHPLKERVRAKANHYLTGRDGGREIDLRRFAAEGMQLHGKLRDVRDGRLAFAPDLRQNLDQADAVAESIKATIDEFIAQQGITAPADPPYRPVWAPPADEPSELDIAACGIRTVIWCMGYRSDFGWIDIPVFDGKGYPGHRRGVTPVPGLYFLGLPWLYTWGSGRFSGVGQDARHLADTIEARHRAADDAAVEPLNELALGS